VETDYAGNIQETCTNLPFGDGGTPCLSPTEQFFTGKERDQESGNDYFEARYYASTMGRFLSPDPLLNSGRPDNPQSWNRYSYVSNNPLAQTDPTGMYTVGSCNADADTCKKMASNLEEMHEDIVQARFRAAEAGDMDAVGHLSTAVDNLGAPGEKNSSGQTITINLKEGMEGQGLTRNSGTSHVSIDLNPAVLNQAEKGADVLAHEATHVTQKNSDRYFNGLGWDKAPSRAWFFDIEWEPFMTQSYFDQYSPIRPAPESATLSTTWGNAELWNSSWSKVDVASKRFLGVWTAAHADADIECKEAGPQCK
jgi:RHS repeat-associated protein